MRSFISVTILLCVSFGVLTGCSSSDAEPEEIVTEAPQSQSEDTMPVVEGEPVLVGVLSNRSAVATQTQYRPVMMYLSQTVGRPFELVPFSFTNQVTEVEKGNVDFLLSNPLASTQTQRLYNTRILATIARVNTGSQFAGLIITRNDDSINSVEDMHGKSAACVDFETGAAGCIFQIFHLKEQGFDVFTDFAQFIENPSQDNIVLGVLNGTYDVGFIRTGQLEKMVADNTLLSVDEVSIIDESESDFFYPHTTILYPEWAFAALSKTDDELADAVQEALVNLPEDYPGLSDVGIVGFVEAADYTPLHTLIEALQLMSWDSEVVQD